jgi:hypothetical protein
MPGGPAMPGAPGAGSPAPAGGQGNAAHWRTEFVIFFIWKEWTPSDELRGQTGDQTGEPKPQ